jgi:hypothetical protein
MPEIKRSISKKQVSPIRINENGQTFVNVYVATSKKDVEQKKKEYLNPHRIRPVKILDPSLKKKIGGTAWGLFIA